MGKAENKDAEGAESKEPVERTPLPLGPFSALFVTYFTNSLSQTILFPFAAVMVSSFHVTDDPAKLGYYAGYLASSAFTGSLLSSAFWGALSDRVGRKPVLLTGLTMNFVCAILFGSSRSFAMAMIVRFINGLFSTIIATGRSAVAELCDNTNQAKGFALIGTTFGAGLLIGPALGGFLSQPAEKYPALFPKGGFFDHFPFLLPCLVLAGLTLLGLLSTYLFLPETLGRAKAIGGEKEFKRSLSRRDSCSLDESVAYSRRFEAEVPYDALVEDGEEEGGEGAAERGRRKQQDRTKEGGQGSNSLQEPLLASENGHGRDVERAQGNGMWKGIAPAVKSPHVHLSFDKGELEEAQQQTSESRKKLSRKNSMKKEWSMNEFLKVFFIRDTIISITIFCVLSLAATGFNEVFPLWCITPWELGGLSFDTNQIAVAQVTAGIALIPMQIYVYAPLVNKYGAVNALRTAVAVGVLLLFFPLVKNFGKGTVGMQVGIALFMALRSFPQCVFTSVFILISNSVEDPTYLGAVNGLSQTLNMTFRAIAPTAGGSLFAWSTSQRGKFVNANLWFYCIGVLYTVMFFVTFALSPNAENRKFVTAEEIKKEEERGSRRR